MTKGVIVGRLGELRLAGDRRAAIDLFFAHVLPNPDFSNAEMKRLAYRVGAFDEGEDHVLTRADL